MGSSDATLSDLVLKDGDDTAVSVAPAFAPETLSYTAAVEYGLDEITIIPTGTNSNSTFEYQDESGTALVDADLNKDDFQVAFSGGIKVIKVVATAEDTIATQTYTVVVTTLPAPVPSDWSLIPAGLGGGDQFRLLFLSSTKRDGSSSDISDYNTFIQDLAAAGHTDIRAYSSGFRVVGCTTAVDARDNTGSTYTNSDKGVPIYWLGGSKAADDYADFYDGSWDDEANDRDESGALGPNTSLLANYPITGCDHDGTEAFFSNSSRALGGGGNVGVGRPNDSSSGSGPIGSAQEVNPVNNRPLYGLSEVFRVGNATDATLSDLALKDGDGMAVSLAPAFTPETLRYTAAVVNGTDEITIIPTVNDDNAAYKIQDRRGRVLVDADSTQDDFQVSLSVGMKTIKVKVTAEDAATSQTYTVVVTTLPAPVPYTWRLTPAGLGVGDQFPAAVPLLHQARRIVLRHLGLQHLHSGPRRRRPH